MSILTLDNVCKQYGDNLVVDNVSLRIAAGEFVALLGPSGCGKTTILRMLAGFEAISGGLISLGTTIFNDYQANIAIEPEKRGLGMVFQSYALWPHMSVFDNVAYPLKISGMAKSHQQQKVADVLTQMELRQYSKRYPKELSGGQQQRVALARSLVMRPKVILLDEPLANLDRHLRANMQETFKTFNRESGTTFLYVTHDQHEAMAMADKIAVLKQGKLLQYASPDTLYCQPDNEWIATFIGEGNLLPVATHEQGVTLHSQRAQQAIISGLEQANAQALIRPEHVHLCDHGIAANIEHSRFLGERYLLTLRLSTGNKLAMYANHVHPIGSKIHFAVDRLWVLPKRL